MADDFGFQPTTQPNDNLGFQPIPKMPDMSGVNKMVQQNLIVPKPDEAEVKQTAPPSPEQKINTGLGMSVSGLLKADDNTQISAPIRTQYTKSLQDGTAVDFGDFAHSMLHSVASTMELAKATYGGMKQGFEGGEMIPPDISSNVRTMGAQAINLPYRVLGAGLGAFQGTVTKLGEQTGLPALGRDIGLFPESMMGIEGMAPHPPEVLKSIVGKEIGKPADAVSPSDIEQTIATGAKPKAPTGNDFKAVETISNIPEKQLQNVYNETGVKPDQVFSDAQKEPSIATDVAAGKVPELYEHLVEEKSALQPTEAERLTVNHDEASRSFTVVDKEGDHVSGGFDSAEEARHFIEDEKFKAEERAAIEQEGKTTPIVEKTEAGEQTVIPGAEKVPDRLLAEREMEGKMQALSTQKPTDEGLFDVNARNQQDLFTPKPKLIPPSEIGKSTSLRTFLMNNGAKLNEADELLSIKKNGSTIKGAEAQEYAHEIAKEHGYLPKDEDNQPPKPLTDLKNALTEKGGREHFRDADADRVAKAKESAEAKKNFDPAKIEQEARNAGLDTDIVKDESDKARTSRLVKALQDFYKDEEGSGITFRKAIGDTINAVEKYTGKLTGNLFQKLGDSYIRTFQPELVGPLAKRADAYLAKFKAKAVEAENALFRRDVAEIRRVDKLTDDQRREWLYDHETGRWNEEENPDHAAEQAIYDSMRKTEQEAGVGTANYKKNYLPHQFEKADEVSKFFRSEGMIKKYGQNWFNKASEFQLVQEAERAGFKLTTNNYIRMRIARQLASDNMLRTADLLKDMESDGIATRATTFGIDKKIAKTSEAIKALEEKYQKAFDKVNNPDQTGMEGMSPVESKLMKTVKERLDSLQARLEGFTKEKEANKLSPEQMKELKDGFRIIGPDSKAWNIHQQAGSLWKNAMEMKGLWERQGVLGDSYRSYMAGKAIYVRSKMLASLWHPTHEVVIDISSDIASAIHHLTQGGKLSDLATKEMVPNIGLGRSALKLDDPIGSWNTAPKLRTPEQQAHVNAMNEGGLVPQIPAQDKVRFRENFDKAINGIGLNNLRLFTTALEALSMPMAPLMEHWIPQMKVDSYFQRRELALKRDPSLLNDAGRRAEVMRGIVQDIERNYGEMNRNTLFWNPIIKDIFNATTFSAGWKLAMLQNMRGLAEPGKIAYNFAKTGEFSKEQITHQMLQSYVYTASMLMLGAGITKMLTGTVGTLKDWINPPTGEKNADGTPIRLRQPAFFNEPMMLFHDINADGVVSGTGSFLYHQTLIPGIADSLLGRDFVGRPYITNPIDLQQWKNMGLDSINPILITNTERSEEKGANVAKYAGFLGFPLAGSWVNQTPFEQKIISAYDKQHPAEGDAYTAKLKAEMKGAIADKDTKQQSDIARKMKNEGMTDAQIEHSKTSFKTPFAEFAWSKLSPSDQKRLISSASDEEKKKFKIHGE